MLKPQERLAQANFLATLEVRKRSTRKPVIVAMVGLVGSGKSSVAARLATHLGGTIVEGDRIRVELRKERQPYENARHIGEDAALEVVRRGGNAILDSDFIDTVKRGGIRAKARAGGIRLILVRTHCDLDVMVGRIITAPYRDRVDDFFGGASSPWSGSEQSKGAAVKIREMWRRTPRHYRWVNQGGGKWLLRRLPFTLFAEIDTTDEEKWPAYVEQSVAPLL